jgi:trk/ktr system potassium uptake protein
VWLALATTGILLLMGTLGFWVFESGNLLRDATAENQILTSFFASVTPRTAGFNSIDYGQTTTATIYLTVVLMMIGGCPGSTAGGIKTTTLAVPWHDGAHGGAVARATTWTCARRWVLSKIS